MRSMTVSPLGKGPAMRGAGGKAGDEAVDERRPVYHVTVLSNFARAYDKYSGRYDKTRIPESTFPDRFFLLDRDEIGIGVAKAAKLLARLELDGDRLIVLETRVPSDELLANTTTGLGRYVERPHIRLTGVHALAAHGGLEAWSVEDATARSLRVLHPRLLSYEALVPRTVSLLPIARGCQARCAFCFSHASISADQKGGTLARGVVTDVLHEGRRRGAERAVITGGGEPGLVPFPELLELVRACAGSFPQKVVLITNGLFLALLDEGARRDALRALEEAGLTVLSLSRHHPEPSVNARIMSLEVGTERVLASVKATPLRALRPRIITVLQKGGVETVETLEALLRWAVSHGVEELTLKELYVATSEESLYHDRQANRWCRENQVPLSLATRFFAERGWERVGQLPWGAPIHEGMVDGRSVRVAAYTEPSLFWERTVGVARSWNVLADGACYASLEDRASRLSFA
jgi:Radical SAM superfamily/4Fe-4S single cluster domain